MTRVHIAAVVLALALLVCVLAAAVLAQAPTQVTP